MSSGAVRKPIVMVLLDYMDVSNGESGHFVQFRSTDKLVLRQQP